MSTSDDDKMTAVREYLGNEFPGYSITEAEEEETGMRHLKIRSHRSYQVVVSDNFLADRDVETVRQDIEIGRLAERIREAPSGKRILLATSGIGIEGFEAVPL
jgi:hypothetical protein